MKRGQGAIEFMVILGVVLFFFVAFFTVIQSDTNQKNLEKERTLAQNIALDVQYEISIASDASEGYYREFVLPEKILGKDYQINLTGNYVYISMEKVGISYKIQEINGTLQKGTNVIQKQNGAVYIN